MRRISNKLIENASKFNRDIKYTYYPYSDNSGYWVLENIFQDIDSFIKLLELIPYYSPKEKHNNSNFMDKQPIFYPLIYDISEIFLDFVESEIKNQININENIFVADSSVNLWFPRKEYKCEKRRLLPHVDVYNPWENRLVFQIWLSDGDNGFTKFWKFRDSSYTSTEEFFRYQQSTAFNPNLNFVEKIEKNFEGNSDFVEVASAPTKKGTITVFSGNQYHTAYLPFSSKKIGRRWSYYQMTNILNCEK